MTQIGVFGHEGIMDETFDEQSDGYHVENKQVEDILPILFEESSQFIPAT